MKISILTLFPEMFKGPFDYSIIKNSVQKKIVEIKFVNIRDFGIGRHKTVDDKPYGGGKGMILRVDVLANAIEKAKDPSLDPKKQKVILLDPHGKTYNQKRAKQLSKLKHLILICGHYEGVDARLESIIDESVSIGDFILTGGEIPAIIIVDSVVRLLRGTFKKGVTGDESFSMSTDKQVSLLEYPQYTRPPVFNKHPVPDVLLSGNHKKIEEWRKSKSLALTKKLRPDLLSPKNPSAKKQRY